MFDVPIVRAFYKFLVFIDGHSDVADFILFPFPGGQRCRLFLFLPLFIDFLLDFSGDELSTLIPEF